jgi:hypothetical protein
MDRRNLASAGTVALILLLGLIEGLGIARWLAENLYGRTSIFFYWLPSAGVAFGCAACLLLAVALAVRLSGGRTTAWRAATTCLPLSLVLVYLAQSEVNPLLGSVLVAGSLALVAALGVGSLLHNRQLDKAALYASLAIPLLAYVRTVAPTVGQYDTFEFQVLSYQLGIAHPTGYPLYVLLGKLFTLLPIGNIAYRVNLSSAAFAASAVALLYATTKLLTRDRPASVLAALSFAFSYAFWTQAVEAEVYALNALFVSALAYLLMRSSLAVVTPEDEPQAEPGRWRAAVQGLTSSRQSILVVAVFVYGLSLTHHRTMLLLAPAILAYVILIRAWQPFRVRRLLISGLTFLAPLCLLHLYIPLRWLQIHGEAMSWQQFSSLVLGTQFSAALRWDAIFRDPQRLTILGRTFLEQYPLFALLLSGAGILWLLSRRSPLGSRQAGYREGVFLLLAFGAYAMFGLSYYVPDVSLFLIPSYAVVSIGLGLGASQTKTLLQELFRRSGGRSTPITRGHVASVLTVSIVAVLPLSLIWANLPRVDKSKALDWYTWGRYALQQDLPAGSVILADSEKMAPLHYLQRVEGLRPDTETAVFSDEEENRAEVQRHLAEGRPVFLGRFLPGLESTYHLRSLGPLVQVSTSQMETVPVDVTPLNVSPQEGLALRGYHLDDALVEGNGPVRVTLYWQAVEAVRTNYEVQLRLVGANGHVWIETKGRAPVNGLYPTGAWRQGEIVPDFHQIELQHRLPPGAYKLQAGLFIPFAQEGGSGQRAGSGYVNLAEIGVYSAAGGSTQIQHDLRADFANQIMLLGYSFPPTVAPGAELPLTLYWQRLDHGSSGYGVLIKLAQSSGAVVWEAEEPMLFGEYPASQWLSGEVLADTHSVIVPDAADGPLQLLVGLRDQKSLELIQVKGGWLAAPAQAIQLNSLTVSTAPSPHAEADFLPANFENKLLLVDYQIHNVQVRQGGDLRVSLVWQALDEMDEDYTVFVHLLDDDDRIVGQEDLQPVYGTYPTTKWKPGELINDPHTVWTELNAPVGLYRIEVGLYLLRNMERLQLIDASGRPIGDRLIIDLMEIVP